MVALVFFIQIKLFFLMHNGLIMSRSTMAACKRLMFTLQVCGSVTRIGYMCLYVMMQSF